MINNKTSSAYSCTGRYVNSDHIQFEGLLIVMIPQISPLQFQEGVGGDQNKAKRRWNIRLTFVARIIQSNKS